MSFASLGAEILERGPRKNTIHAVPNGLLRLQRTARFKDRRVTKVLNHMKANLDQPFNVPYFAEMVSVSPSRLTALFQEEIGQSPMKSFRQLRMSRAAELLIRTPLRVKEIMRRVGWRDESHFVRDFKKTYGTSPTKYRNGHELI